MAGQKRLIQEASIVNNIRTDEGLQVKRGREVLAMPRLASNAIVIAFTVQHLYCYIVLIHAKPQARAVQHSDHRCRDEGSAEKILEIAPPHADFFASFASSCVSSIQAPRQPVIARALIARA